LTPAVSPAVAGTLRLFVALWPTQQTRAAAVAAQRALTWPAGAQLMTASDLHITMVFIGAVPDTELSHAMQAAAIPSVEIELKLDRLEIWKGGIVVLRPSAVPAAMVGLQGRLSESLRGFGVHFDARPFAPHVTLGRKAKGMLEAAPPPLLWRSTGHVLARSIGGRYSVVARFV
jgi:2'-5' RNA ligase